MAASAPACEDLHPRVQEVVDRLAAREPQLSLDLAADVKAGLEPLEHVDPEVHTLLRVAVQENVAEVMVRMREGRPPEHDSISPGTLAYAEELARHDVPSAWLRRAYHLATQRLLSLYFDEVERLDVDPDAKLRLFRHAAGWVHGYIDCTTRLVLDRYESEVARNAERHLTEVSAWVRRVLDSEPVDPAAFAAVTKHALDHLHLGAVLWVEDSGHGPDRSELLRSAAQAVARGLGASECPLVVPVGRSETWVWFSGTGSEPRQHVATMQSALARTPAVRATTGSPESGAEGFRRTIEQARGLRLLVQMVPSVTRQVLAHDDEGMAVVALLAQDLPATRRWVRDVLGPLATDTEGAHRLRETVRTYLSTGSYAETAELLQLHRNTVKYRITKVARDRGRDVTDGRLDLELALQVCHVLGPSVLVGSETTG